MSLFGKKPSIKSALSSLEQSLKTENQPHNNTPQNDLPFMERVYEIRGMSYREKDLMCLAHEQPDWNLSDDELIQKYRYRTILYRYTFTTSPVTLIPDPRNKVDPNAIKIVVAGHHIGFVPAESTAEVKALMAQKRDLPILCAISGGEQKSIKYHSIIHSDYGYVGRIIIF